MVVEISKCSECPHTNYEDTVSFTGFTCSLTNKHIYDKLPNWCPLIKEPYLLKLKEDRIRHLFHKLWGKAVDTDCYNKSEWREFQELMIKKGIF